MEESFSHDAGSLTEIANWLLKLAKGDPSRIAVATEKPHGAVVDSLLTRSIAVYAINPKQVDRFRDRHSVAGAKDDRRDAFVLADALRTDGHRFQRVELPTPEVLALREQLRMDEDLRHEEIALANRLRDHLMRGQPHLLKLAPANLVDPFFWEILEQFGTPQKAQDAQLQTLQALLHQHHIRRLNAPQVLDVLRSPALPVAPGTLEAAAYPIDFLVERLRLNDQQRRLCAKQIDTLLNALGAPDKRHLKKATEFTDGLILSSLPGVGRVVLATVPSEASDALRRRDLNALRALSGVAPVTKQSGKSHQVMMRRACNHALKNALYHWGLIAIQKDARFKKHYDQLHARGFLHARAVRGVMDRILSVAMAMLRDRTLYDRQDPALTRTEIPNNYDPLKPEAVSAAGGNLDCRTVHVSYDLDPFRPRPGTSQEAAPAPGGIPGARSSRQEFGQSFRAIELQTGKVAWSVDRFGAGTVTLAGATLVILRESGELVLAPASLKEFRPASRASLLTGTIRAYPALANGHLYVRNEKTLACFELTQSLVYEAKASL